MSDTARNSTPQQPPKEDLDLLPTLVDVKKATDQMSPGKAPGNEGIPAEIYKTAGPTTLDACRDTVDSISDEKERNRISSMPLLFLSTRTRETKQTVATTKGSHSYPLLGGSLPASS